MSVIVTGIDPSMSGTAICSGTLSGEYRVERFPCSSFGKGVFNRVSRCQSVVSRVVEHLDRWKPKLILIEGYSFGSTNQAAFMAELGGLLRWHLVDYTPHIYEVAPTTMMKFITGKGCPPKGTTTKVAVANAIKLDHGVSFDNDDMSDAYAYYTMCRSLMANTLKTPQTEALDKVFGADLRSVRETLSLEFSGESHVNGCF